MTKIITKNKSSLSIEDAFARILSVIKLGKISTYNGTYGYCYVSTFEDCYVNVNLTPCGTHTFTVTNQ